ncbi:DUF6538 domain-containing protein [Fontisubflavum oceani]|uniref:DUF6538 domain-containing protein n=1 Tax=Fontisubflavum oceani TaxID=2978973 RepID=UPI002ED039B4
MALDFGTLFSTQIGIQALYPMRDSLIQIGKTWHLRRRVPNRFKPVEPREVIKKSLKTDSRAVAAQKAVAYWNELIENWELLLAGDVTGARER